MNIKDFILGYVIGKNDGGGGGSSVDVEPLSATQNGEYSEEGVAYSPVTVDVPNSYTAGDEGKVVSNGALVAQSSDTVTANDTYDTTLINSLTVNVSGGASPWTLVTEQDEAISTTSTTETTAATIECGSSICTKDKIVWVHIRDKAGKREGYFYGTDAFFINIDKANNDTSVPFNKPAALSLRYGSSIYSGYAGMYGVYGYSISSTGQLIIKSRYNSTNSKTIDGTYSIKVYTLDLPAGTTLFDS